MSYPIRSNGRDGVHLSRRPNVDGLCCRTTDSYEPSPRKATEGLDTGRSLTAALQEAIDRARDLEVKGGLTVSSESEDRRQNQERLKRMNRENREFWKNVHGER